MRVPDDELYNVAIRESKMLETLSHQNVIKVIDVFYNAE